MGKPILKVLQGLEPERRPIWLMRQAGRYLPEYREIREKAKNFLNMCLTPDLATEITLQPIRRFDLDAAILFADILLIPYALGQSLEFREGEGPVLEQLSGEAPLAALSYKDERLAPVYETLRQVKKELSEKTALIGFCGAPWTVACYMIDGNSKNNFSRARSWVLQKPDLLNQVIKTLVDASEKYLTAQIEAGAEIIQIFDSWSGLLKDAEFARWVIEPTLELVSRIKRKYPNVPIIGFPREAGSGYLPYIRETGVDAVGLDQFVNIDFACQNLQSIKPLQGNLDPDLLVLGGDAMKQAITAIMRKFGLKHIINLGHGVLPQTPPEHVVDLVQFVRNFEG